jgi:SpoVK/Ycf46/Vps4 family AAA+-type ATPase
MIALREDMKAEKVYLRHFEQAAAKVKPSKAAPSPQSRLPMEAPIYA